MKTFIVTLLLTLSILYTGHSEAAIPDSIKHTNSLGVTPYETNPYTYKVARVKDVQVFPMDGQDYTEVLYSPYGTYSDFLETITFCGDETDRMEGKSTLMVFTYLTHKARKMCSELMEVDELKPRKAPWE